MRRIIANGGIQSQATLRTHLMKNGFEVTQATLSRDLKQLKVGKVLTGDGSYTYALPESEIEAKSDFIDDLLRGWLSIEFSANLGVVKTWPGHADSVAIALDNLDLPELLGTVAGDDTIILVLNEGATKEVLMKKLNEHAPRTIAEGEI